MTRLAIAGLDQPLTFRYLNACFGSAVPLYDLSFIKTFGEIINVNHYLRWFDFAICYGSIFFIFHRQLYNCMFYPEYKMIYCFCPYRRKQREVHCLQLIPLIALIRPLYHLLPSALPYTLPLWKM